MSGPRSQDENTTTDIHHLITGQMDVSSLKSRNRNISQNSSSSFHYTEKVCNIQSPSLCDDLCTVSEVYKSSSENFSEKMCNGVDHDMDMVSGQMDTCKGESVSARSNSSDHYDQQLNIISKPYVIEDGSSCMVAVDSCLQNPGKSDSGLNHCVGSSLIRSNSFTDTSSLDQLQVLCSATRKLAGSPKPVLRRHSMTSRQKKQVTIEANAKVIEIDRVTSESPEIESGNRDLIVGSESNSIMTSKSEFSGMYVDTVSESELASFDVSQEVNGSSLTLGNLPLAADTLSVVHDSAAGLQESSVSRPQKDINASDTDTSPPRAVDVTAGRCRSYEVRCVEKSRVRHLIDEDDDSCGDEADDESTANEELDSECKEEREHRRKRRKSVEDEIEKVVSSSPNGRFLKFDWEIGCGSFKTVYKGLDSETGVHIAWCELQVSNSGLITHKHSTVICHAQQQVYCCMIKKGCDIILYNKHI